MRKLHTTLIEINRSYLIMVGISAAISLSLFSSLLAEYLESDSLNNALVEGRSVYQKFLLVILIAPFIETLLYQFGIIELIQHLAKDLSYKNWVSILSSATLFGLSHWASTYYMMFAIIMGLLFGYFYILGRIRKDITPFLLVFLMHLSVNGMAFLANEFT